MAAERSFRAETNMELAVQVAGRTDVGCVRANNEDNFGYDWDHGIYVVCDGMGGLAAGEVASKIAVDTVLDYFRKGRHGDETGDTQVSHRAAALAGAVRQANENIRVSARSDFSRSGMGCTVAAVLVEGNNYSIAHVGDSRIYLLRDDTIQQLTNDHSLVMEQVRRGLITIEEAHHSEMQNIITRALGSEDAVDADLADATAEPGDTLLLTSDGMTRHVPDDVILRIVNGASGLREACDALIEAAKQGGGTDNITCLLLRFVEKGWLHKLFGGGPGGGSPRSQESI